MRSAPTVSVRELRGYAQDLGKGQLTPRVIVALFAVSGVVFAAGCAIAGLSSIAVPLLVGTQALGLLWIGMLGWTRSRTWASVLVILAASWALIFLVPSLLYALDSDLLDATSRPVETLGLLNLSLFCLAVPIAFLRARSGSSADAPMGRLVVRVREWSPAWIWGWGIAGLAGLALVFQGAGGVIEYVTNLDKEGRFNLGRVYLVWLALFTRYAAQIALYRRWSQGEPARAGLIAVVVLTIALTALLGARLFVAVALVEIVLFFSIVRRRLSLRVILPVTLMAGFAVILLGGAVKRYDDYQALHVGRDKAFSAYLLNDAPAELRSAYANNYADGVRLIAVSRATVPEYADFEYGKIFLRYAVQPIPRKWRPAPGRPEALKRALYPGGGYAHAIPLQATSYIQGGPLAVIFAFLLLGTAVAFLDRRLSGTREASLTTVVALTTAAVAIPSYLRASEAGGIAIAALDILGLSLVAFTADGGMRRLRNRARELWTRRSSTASIQS
jgi:hypothetical protein